MTVRLWCSPDVHMAKVDNDIVVLDVGADRYHCLLDAAGLLRLEEDGAVVAADEAVAADLQDAGLARPAPSADPRPTLTVPRRELTLPAEPSRTEVLRAAIAWILSTGLFQRKSLPALIDCHRARRGSSARGDEDRLATLVSAARKARPWIPFEGECLQRSFQLRHFLAGRGVATDWVFGVRTWPFGAHCWLQIGDLVVGDRLDRVRRYTPIMSA